MERLAALLLLVCVSFIAIGGLLYIQPPTVPSNNVNVVLKTPPSIALNSNMQITLSHLRLNTTYEIQFMTSLYYYKPQQTFIANQSIYSTVLFVSAEYNFNNTLKLLVFEPSIFQYVAIITIPIRSV